MLVTFPATLPQPVTEYSLIFIITHPAQDIRRYTSHTNLVPGSHSLLLFHTQYPGWPFRAISADLHARLQHGEKIVFLLYAPSFSIPFNHASRLRTLITDLQVALVYIAPPDRLFVGWALEWCRAAAVSDEPGRGEALANAYHAHEWVKGSFEGALNVTNGVDVQGDYGIDAVQIPSVLEAPLGGRAFCSVALLVDGNATNAFVAYDNSIILRDDMMEPIRLWAAHQARFSGRVIVTWDGNVSSTIPLPAIQAAIRNMSTALGFPVYLFYLHQRPSSSHAEDKWDPLLFHPVGYVAFLHRRHRLNLHKTLCITNRLLYPWVRRVPPAEWIRLDRNSIPRVTGRSVMTVVGVPAWLDEVDEPRFGPSGARGELEPSTPYLPLTSGVTSEGGQIDGYTHSIHAGDNISLDKWIGKFRKGVSKTNVNFAIASAASQTPTSNSSQLGSPPPTMTQMFQLPAFTQIPSPLSNSQSDSQTLRRLPNTFQSAPFSLQPRFQSTPDDESQQRILVVPPTSAKTRAAETGLSLSKSDVLPQQAGKLGAIQARANESGSDTDDFDEGEGTPGDWSAKDTSSKARTRGRRKTGSKKAAMPAPSRKRKLLGEEPDIHSESDADPGPDNDDEGDTVDMDAGDFPVRRHKRARRSLAETIAEVTEAKEPQTKVAAKELGIVLPSYSVDKTSGPIVSPSVLDLPPMPRFTRTQYLRPDTQTQSTQSPAEPSTSTTDKPPGTGPTPSLVELLFGQQSRGTNPPRLTLRKEGPLVPAHVIPVPTPQQPGMPVPDMGTLGLTRAEFAKPAAIAGICPGQQLTTLLAASLFAPRPAPTVPAPEPGQRPLAPEGEATVMPARLTVPHLTETRRVPNAGGGLLADMLFGPRKAADAPKEDAK